MCTSARIALLTAALLTLSVMSDAPGAESLVPEPEFVKKITSSDAAPGDLFGYNQSLGDNILIVTSRNDDGRAGAAYVFERDLGGPQNWGERARITASDRAPNDQFGVSSSISGDIIVVGAFRDDDLGQDSGAAYVFERDAGGPDQWGQVAKLTAFDGMAGDFFGRAVTIDADTIVVGAFSTDDGFADAGAAYVFERDNGGADAWGLVKKIKASDPGPQAFFGRRVALSSDTLVVGAYGDDDNGSEAGAAYVFERDSGGQDFWGEAQKILPSDGEAGDNFARAVAIEGDIAIIGAYKDDDNGTDAGAAYVYQRDFGGFANWTEVTKLTASDGENGDAFGFGVSISADVALIAARFDDDNGADAGAAYVFSRHAMGPDTWAETRKLLAFDGEPGDLFGNWVAIRHSLAVVGAREDDDLGQNAGAVHLYTVSNDPVPDVKIDLDDGPTLVSLGETLNVGTAIDPGDQTGREVDILVGVRTPSGIRILDVRTIALSAEGLTTVTDFETLLPGRHTFFVIIDYAPGPGLDIRFLDTALAVVVP